MFRRQTFKYPVLEIDCKNMAMGCVCIKKQRIVQYAFKDKLMLSFSWSIHLRNFTDSIFSSCLSAWVYCVLAKKEQFRSKLCYTADMTRFPDQLCGQKRYLIVSTLAQLVARLLPSPEFQVCRPSLTLLLI